MELQSPTTKPLLRVPLLIAPFFLWGTAMVAMKGVIPDTAPFFLATMRLAPAGVLVLLAALLMKRSFQITRQGWWWISLFALVDGTLFQGFLAQGLVRTGAGLGSVMIDSQPLAVALMARWLFKEQVGPLGWLGLLVGLSGISLLGLPDEWFISLFQGNFTLAEIPADGMALLRLLFDQGEWLMLMAALSMAVGTILIRYVAEHADPVVATGWHMILGGLPLAVLSLMGETHPWIGLGLSGWGAIAYSTILGSALAYGIFFYLASKGNLTSLSALTFLTPVFALLFGNLFLGEVLSSIQTAGVALTIVSIYLINQRDVLMAFLTKKLELFNGRTAESES
ncbi:DMT family transporter [Oscillatoria sp. CS-180]|uniref:DMT family transporter n=1 Tax=Oscillatoria sp. CS-180 TaxID=3021720 RepID=UPI00232BFC72|nr:DMT family transporter [Oscillatoria sp. CS-180]MDB9529895.1 DMT family transporter [Oscillatoria sp. CS-180]